ncbi:unnamed protein product [Phytophthora fragariaefolia]|uniref:Unnamed protein product n=1 Tax=Phytophthora fragariaefolia TaxID=1490495 RepID=A0A9W7D705_9STRA|nr:unnamed protein product [Phytophthora fragariaefolia]
MSSRRTTRHLQGANGATAANPAAQDGEPLPPARQNDAVVAPAIASQAAATDGAPEPDDGPKPAIPRVEGGNDANVGARKCEGKIDLRNVKMAQFTGTDPWGPYDSGVRDWRDQFADQVADAQVMAAQEWSEAAQNSVLSIFVTGPSWPDPPISRRKEI